MSTRITTRSMQEATLANLQRNLSSMATSQQQLSSGSRINKPSDDPAGTVTSLQLQQQLRNADQYSRNVTDGQSWLNTIDTALQSSVSQLNTAYDRGIQANAASASGPGPTAAIVSELQGIKKTMISLANTQYAGRNVFAGTSGATTAVTVDDTVTPPTYTWSGTGSGTVERRIDANSTVRVDSDGAAIFGKDDPSASPPTTSVFTDIDNMIKAVQGLNSSTPSVVAQSRTDLGTAMDALQKRTTAISTELSSVGAREQQLNDVASSIADGNVDLQSSLSAAKDTDVAKTYLQLQMQNTAYQASLQVTAKVLQPTLLQFLA